MSAASSVQASDLDFDHGTFDAAAFTATALSSRQALAGVIDHTLLKPEATREQVENLCDEAVRYRFACAMVNPTWVPTAVSVLAGTGIPVGVVIGFPLGASLGSTLRQEAAAPSTASQDGCSLFAQGAPLDCRSAPWRKKYGREHQ